MRMQSPSNQSLLDAALFYASCGLHVFPLWPVAGDGMCACGSQVCSGGGKHPRVKWKDGATDNAETVRDWWTRWPDAGIGIATGARSRLWVLDIDKNSGGFDSLLDLQQEHGDLPDTYTVQTGGGGAHWYFRHDGQRIANSAGRVAPGIDVRGDGGYVVAPPSPHRSGRAYAVTFDAPPSLAPDWLVGLVAGGGGSGPRARSDNDRKITDNRNDTLMRQGCALRSAGLGRAAIEAALLAQNEALCVPPMSDAEVKKIAASCAQYEQGQPGRALEKVSAAELMSSWAKEQGPIRGVVDDTRIGREMLSEYEWISKGVAPVFDQDQMWRCTQRGVWIAIDERDQARTIQRYSGRMVITGYDSKTGDPQMKPLTISRSRVEGARKCAQDEAHRLGFFDAAPVGIGLANGFLTVDHRGWRLLDHSPENRCRFALPVEWNPDADCNRWMSYLSDVFQGPEMQDKADLLQEFFGACLAGIATKYQRCLVMYGRGRNGKSTAMDVLEGLFPPEARACVRPQEFTEDYKVATLRGARVNLCGEIPDGDVAGSDRFKSIVAGETVTARHPYGKAFTFKPEAGIVVSCNALPGSSDVSDGYWRRFLLLHFANQIQPQDMVRGLAQIILREELAGVLSWMVDGAIRLIKTGAYTVPQSSQAMVDEWRMQSNVVAMWVDEMCDLVTAAAGVKSFELYREFRDYCQDRGYRPMAERRFIDRLKQMGMSKTHQRDGNYWPLRLKPGTKIKVRV